MEIVEKVKLRSILGKEIEAKIDTGAEVTVFEKDILLKLGAPHIENRPVDFDGQKKEIMPVYRLIDMQIQNCVINFPEVIFGKNIDKKNLTGHDVLQKAKAIIDEGKGIIEFPEDDGTIEI